MRGAAIILATRTKAADYQSGMPIAGKTNLASHINPLLAANVRTVAVNGLLANGLREVPLRRKDVAASWRFVRWNG